jgi:hypothetical protein
MMMKRPLSYNESEGSVVKGVHSTINLKPVYYIDTCTPQISTPVFFVNRGWYDISGQVTLPSNSAIKMFTDGSRTLYVVSDRIGM